VERDSGIDKRRRKLRFLGLGFLAHRGFGVRTMTPEGVRVREGICGAVRDLKSWSRTVCGAGRVMYGGGCGITSTRGVWVCGTMVVGRRFRVCVVRGRELASPFSVLCQSRVTGAGKGTGTGRFRRTGERNCEIWGEWRSGGAVESFQKRKNVNVCAGV